MEQLLFYTLPRGEVAHDLFNAWAATGAFTNVQIIVPLTAINVCLSLESEFNSYEFYCVLIKRIPQCKVFNSEK